MSEPRPPKDPELDSLLSGQHPIAKRYQQQRVEPPTSLKAAIDKARMTASDQQQPRTSPFASRRRHRAQWLAAAAISGIAALPVWYVLHPAPPLEGYIADDRVDPHHALMPVVRGAYSDELSEAENLRLEILLDHPDWSTKLSAAENGAWRRAAEMRCASVKPADADPADSSVVESCLRSQGVRRQQYLRRAYLLPAEDGLYGEYSNGLFGTVRIARTNNPRVVQIEIEAYDPATGHVGQVSGAADQNQLLLKLPQGGGKPCQVQLRLSGRELEAMSEYCEDYLGAGVSLSGTYRRLSEKGD